MTSDEARRIVEQTPGGRDWVLREAAKAPPLPARARDLWAAARQQYGRRLVEQGVNDGETA